MKTTILSLLLLIPSLSVAAESEDAAENKQVAAKIAMFTNVVKADKIADFEAFVSTFRGAVEGLIKDGKLDAEEAKAYEGFRVIKQDGASGDSVTYLFVMDPYVADSSYSLSEYLTRGLGKEKAGEQLAIFKSCLAGPQTPFLGTVQ